MGPVLSKVVIIDIACSGQPRPSPQEMTSSASSSQKHWLISVVWMALEEPHLHRGNYKKLQELYFSGLLLRLESMSRELTMKWMLKNPWLQRLLHPQNSIYLENKEFSKNTQEKNYFKLLIRRALGVSQIYHWLSGCLSKLPVSSYVSWRV